MESRLTEGPPLFMRIVYLDKLLQISSVLNRGVLHLMLYDQLLKRVCIEVLSRNNSLFFKNIPIRLSEIGIYYVTIGTQC